MVQNNGANLVAKKLQTRINNDLTGSHKTVAGTGLDLINGFLGKAIDLEKQKLKKQVGYWHGSGCSQMGLHRMSRIAPCEALQSIVIDFNSSTLGP